VAHTNQAAAELNRTRFEPYGFTAGGTKPGVQLTGLSTTGSAIGFTGHVNDPQTDLVYMQQRYYDPIAGRFLSVDPVVTDASIGRRFNRYVYANNSPYKYVDPDGRQERGAQNFSDATAKANGWAGFQPKQSAQEIYNKSAAVATETGLPGRHNGPQDAVRHCIGSAETARQYGGVVAVVVGEANEKKGDITLNQTSEEKSMDRHNNLEGVKIGSGSKSFEQIVEQCVTSVESGKTVNSLPATDKQHPYRSEVDKK
jgi:RHS repeat-associated protein